MGSISDDLIKLAGKLSDDCSRISFPEPVWTVYNTFDYAIAGYVEYVRRYGNQTKRAVYMGMNPGPWGMAQTGVPFGEIAAVRDWMGIDAEIGQPGRVHPKRPIEGFACARSEVSGRRLWGLFAEIWGSPEAFFKEAFVLNYCPLAFLLETGANLTPDKLPADSRKQLEAACDNHLREVIDLLCPEIMVGVGGYARKCLERLDLDKVRIGTILHPSPASPVANREWPHRPMEQLKQMALLC